MKEIRRRTRVVGAFPDGQSCLNLAAARLRYIAGTAWSAKCYMNMRPLSYLVADPLRGKQPLPIPENNFRHNYRGEGGVWKDSFFTRPAQASTRMAVSSQCPLTTYKSSFRQELSER